MATLGMVWRGAARYGAAGCGLVRRGKVHMKMREIIEQRDEASKTALELAMMLIQFCEAVETQSWEHVLEAKAEARRLLKKIQGEQ